MVSDQTLIRLLRSPAIVRLCGDLMRVAIAAVVILVIALQITQHVVVGRFMFDRLHMNDFGKFYYSAQSFLAGQDLYEANPATELPVSATETRQFRNLNPPHFHLVVLPLAPLEPTRALAAWLAINTLAFVASAVVIARELGFSWALPRVLWTVGALVSTSIASILVVTGQLTGLLTLVTTLIWRAARRRQWARAGLWLGLGASVKPFLGLLWLYFALTGRWRAAGWAAAAAASAFALGAAIFGAAAHAAWIHSLRAVDWAWAPMNGSLAGLVARGLTPTPVFTPILNAPDVATLLAPAMGLSVAVASLLVFSRRRHHEDIDLSCLGVLLGAQLASPLGWFYYLPLAAGPAVALALRWPTRLATWLTVWLCLGTPGLFLPLGIAVIGRSQPLGGITLGSLYTWTTLALWLAAVAMARAKVTERLYPPPTTGGGAK